MTTEKKLTGFARMTPEQRTAVGKKGGLAAQASPKARRWSPEEAKARAGQGGAANVAKGGYQFTDADRAKAKEVNPGFDSETARAANGRRYDLELADNPDVEWAEGYDPRVQPGKREADG